jgi:serine phosphatase RsbU (regulator of sigma subunit)
MPLGLMQGMDYKQNETTFQPGDEILFCTDGVIEAHDPGGEMFGTPRLRSLLASSVGAVRGSPTCWWRSWRGSQERVRSWRTASPS